MEQLRGIRGMIPQASAIVAAARRWSLGALHMLGFPHGNLWDSLHGGNQETYGDTSNTWEYVDINGI